MYITMNYKILLLIYLIIIVEFCLNSNNFIFYSSVSELKYEMRSLPIKMLMECIEEYS